MRAEPEVPAACHSPRWPASSRCHGKIIDTVGNELRKPSRLPLLIWRACSGIAHGDLWATINVAQREDLDGAPHGMVHSRVTVGVENLYRMTATTIELTKVAWSLYDQRGRPPY